MLSQEMDITLDEFNEITGNRYILGKTIGFGSYAVVLSAVDKVTGDTVAIKIIYNLFKTIVNSVRILREVKILSNLKHENIITRYLSRVSVPNKG
jgi:serine/threonine protein kinase